MTLRLNLAQGESVLIGQARVQNGGAGRCTLIISGNEKVLREKRIMLERDATTPIKRLYFAVQSIYLAEEANPLFPIYHNIARDAVLAWPMLTLQITDVSQWILDGNYYEALNQAHALIEVEQDLLQGTVRENP
jgi:flagellar protein FlbT